MDDHFTKEERSQLEELLGDIERSGITPKGACHLMAMKTFVTELLDEIETARDMALEHKEERD